MAAPGVMKPRRWIVTTQMDELFALEPLGERTRALLSVYAGEAFPAGQYDLRTGRKLADYLE